MIKKKLSSVVDNDVVKKTEYDKLYNKVNDIETSGFVLKLKITLINKVLKKINDADKKNKYLILVDLFKK